MGVRNHPVAEAQHPPAAPPMRVEFVEPVASHGPQHQGVAETPSYPPVGQIAKLRNEDNMGTKLAQRLDHSGEPHEGTAGTINLMKRETNAPHDWLVMSTRAHVKELDIDPCRGQSLGHVNKLLFGAAQSEASRNQCHSQARRRINRRPWFHGLMFEVPSHPDRA